MLTSITPLGERSRNRNWHATVFAYFAGSIAGGAVLGLTAALAGIVLPQSRFDAVLVATGIGVVIASEAGWLRIGPWGTRQVNEDWLDEYRGWVVGAGFGFQLGLGLVTIVTTLAIPAAILAAVMSHSPAWALATGTTFGLVRALPILKTRPVTSPSRLAALHRSHDSIARAARLSTAAAVAPLLVIAVIS